MRRFGGRNADERMLASALRVHARRGIPRRRTKCLAWCEICLNVHALLDQRRQTGILRNRRDARSALADGRHVV